MKSTIFLIQKSPRTCAKRKTPSISKNIYTREINGIEQKYAESYIISNANEFKNCLKELATQSRLIGESVREIGFREKFNLNILGINRKGDYLLKNMAEQKLRFGDAILVQGTWDEIELLSRETRML